MNKRIIALLGALVMLLTFFTACGNGGTQSGKNPQKSEPQLVIAANPVFVYDDESFSLAYNDLNESMSADSQSSSLTAIADSCWSWTYGDTDGWVKRAVYGFGRWKNGAGTQAKGIYAYSYADSGNTSLGVYAAGANELVTYRGETVPDTGILLSAVVGAEEGLCYTVKQDGTMTIPEGTFTAIEQVAGVKTGFLAEDGTARSASVRILVNSAQIFSGTLKNSTAAEDGVAVTQLSYDEIGNIPVKAGDAVIISVKLDAQANSDADVSTDPTVTTEEKWQVVNKSKQVLIEDTTPQESDVTTADGAIKTISNYQFTFTLVRADKYITPVTKMSETIMKRTGAEVFISRPEKETKYEIVIGVCEERPESKKIYNELVGARADNAADYVLRLVGTKLYIIGVNDDALQAGMDYFLATFVKDDKGAVPAKYNYYYKPDHVTYTIAGQNIATYTIRTERYPSIVLQKAAEAIQETVLNDCGYIIPIKILNIEGTDLGDNEIRIGPMQGSVQIHRDWDYHLSDEYNRFTVGDWTEYMSIDEDGWLEGDYGDWTVKMSGKNVVVEGGAAYSVNVGVMKFLSDLTKNKSVSASYAASGNYTSYYDWENLYEYKTVDYAMAEGYGLTWEENFDYAGTNKQVEKEVYKKWDFSTKTDHPDISDETVAYHPRQYGENWWIAADTAANNYLFEISKKRTTEFEGSDHGWEAVRILTDGKMGFRYGIWECRMIMGSHNGASGSMWCATASPYSCQGPWLEFDVYENYSRELFVPCTHHFMDSTYLGNYHFQAPYYQEKCWIEPNEGEHYYDTFHHFALEWNYDFVGFYLDGVCVSEMPMTNYEDFKYYRTGVGIKISLGAGALNYSATMPEGVPRTTTYVPKYWIGEENVHKYFEVQLIDHTRIYQTSNEGIDNKQAENEMRFTTSYGRY